MRRGKARSKGRSEDDDGLGFSWITRRARSTQER